LDRDCEQLKSGDGRGFLLIFIDLIAKKKVATVTAFRRLGSPNYDPGIP
jgi:hypothetical protein